MRDKFNRQLQMLNEELILMASMIKNAITLTIEAFFAQNTEMAKQIMMDDEQVDQEQKQIENLCFQLLVQQQPVATDLRIITAAMKMVTDMERIGDQAADIAELTIMMSDSPYLLNIDNIRKMSEETIWMLQKAVEAYVEKDGQKARGVIDHDDVVDELFVRIKGELIEVMQDNRDYAGHAADLLMVNKYLERIGDHATNLAEWVLFCIEER